MSVDLFTAQQNFQKPLIDPAQNLASKRDYTTSLKKNEFKSTQSERSERSEIKQSEQNEKFAQMMEDLKKKETEKNKAAPKEVTKESVDNIRNEISMAELEKSIFKTEQSTPLAFVLNAIEPENGGNAGGNIIDLADIGSLNEQIQKLIEAQAELNNGEGNTATNEAEISITTTASKEDIESIFALISSFYEDQQNGAKLSDNEQLASIIEKLQNIAKSDDDAELITISLSPEQLTQLQDIAKRYLKNEQVEQDKEALEALAANFSKLEPPTKQAKKDVEVTSLPVITEQANQPIKQEAANLTEKLNNNAQENNARYNAKYDARYDSRYSDSNNQALSEDSKAKESDFRSALKSADINGKTAINDNRLSSGERFLQSTNLLSGAHNLIDVNLNQNSNVNAAAQGIQTPLQSSLTNVITQSQNPTQAHPATQMVSATIQKAIKAGEETNIKLRLDPPELGRVEIKMSIDKNNKTKIVLTAEKPETYMLLKHDAQTLQNAMQNAGLNSEGNLEFNLASDNHDFNQNNHENKGNGKHANSNAPNEELIESTMDWQVDPRTGRMHYNVLV